MYAIFFKSWVKISKMAFPLNISTKKSSTKIFHQNILLQKKISQQFFPKHFPPKPIFYLRRKYLKKKKNDLFASKNSLKALWDVLRSLKGCQLLPPWIPSNWFFKYFFSVLLDLAQVLVIRFSHRLTLASIQSQELPACSTAKTSGARNSYESAKLSPKCEDEAKFDKMGKRYGKDFVKNGKGIECKVTGLSLIGIAAITQNI